MYLHGKALYKIKFVYIYYNYIFKVSAALHQDVTSLKCFMPEGILIVQNLILGMHSNRLLAQYLNSQEHWRYIAVFSNTEIEQNVAKQDLGR